MQAKRVRLGSSVAAVLVALAVVLACALGAGTAHAATVDDGKGGTLDTMSLPNGEYTVNVKLVKDYELDKSSMAGQVVDGTHALVVKDGVYTLKCQLKSLTMMGEQFYPNELSYYPAYSVSGNMISKQSAAKSLWKSSKPEGELTTVNVPLNEDASSFAKSRGYVLVSVGSPGMPVSPQDAVISIDWASLVPVSIDENQDAQGDGTQQDGNEAGQQEPSSQSSDATGQGDAATQGGTDGQAAGQEGGQASGATTQDTAPVQSATQQPAQTQATTSAAKGLQQGHVYAVPLIVRKSGSSDTSMANQYFGDAAYLRPLADGTYDVRFTTNRADYVLSVMYNGQEIGVSSTQGNTREYRLILPGGQTDRVLPITMKIKPMEELGAGPVNADLYLYLTQANDRGGDTGQMAPQSKDSGTLTPQAASVVAASSTSKVTGTAKTADSGLAGAAGCVALAALALAAMGRTRMRAGA